MKWGYVDIKEVQAARDAMEMRLTAFVSAEVGKFQSDTGVSLDGVNIRFVSLHEIGEVKPKLLVSHVECEIRL